MRKERVIVCGNPDCEAEIRYAKSDEINGKLSQVHCKHCDYTTIPKIFE